MSADTVSPTAQRMVMRARSRPVSALSAVGTLGWRAMLKIKHVPFQLFDVTMTPIMFTLLFTYMFGGALAGSPKVYIQFLLPGILVQTIIFITVYTGVGLNTDIQKGLDDRFRSLPIWQPAPIIGALAGDLFRYSVASTIIIGLGLILGFRPAAGARPGRPPRVWPGADLRARPLLDLDHLQHEGEEPGVVMTTSFVFLMPLTFASNIFVRLETMPAWLQAVVRHNPVTHLSSASRGLMHGENVTADVAWVLAASAAIVLVAAPIALRMYHQER